VTTASASGKVILFGEHGVVYGQPAIAVPVSELRARATVEPAADGAGCTILASDLRQHVRLSSAPSDDPLALIVRLTLYRLGFNAEPDTTITVRSDLPVASGLGSGAAVATAIVRSLALYLGRSLDPATVSSLVYESERIHHGTPSGIDNTVVAYERPIYFVRDQTPVLINVPSEFTLAIADTGIASPTKATVGDVRRSWESDRVRYDTLFDQMGRISGAARAAIEAGRIRELGPLMDENQRLLASISVSSPLLERLCSAARAAGASGAKLSGAGRGGNLIALVEPRSAEQVAAALLDAGAARVVVSLVRRSRAGNRGG
jgi:mevalonate kinase